MQLEEITKELTMYNATNAAIADRRERYMALTINGIDDREGFEAVHIARMDIKTIRVNVEKKAKILKEDALRFQRDVNGEKTRILDLLAPIEDYLSDEENRITEEKTRIKAEAEAKIAAIIQGRVNRLFAMGCRFDGMNYAYGPVIAAQVFINVCTNEDFELICQKITEVIEGELAAKAAEEAARKTEAERLAKITEEQNRIAAEQAKEHERLAAEAKIIQNEKDRLAREAKAAEDAKLKEEQDKLRAIEMEKAKAEAAEKSRLETEARIKRESEEKEAKAEAEAEFRIKMEEKARVAAERKAARRPDKEKVLAYTRALMDVPLPDVKHPECADLLGTALKEIHQVIADLNKILEVM